MGIVLRLLGIALTGVVVGAVVRTRTVHRDYAVLDLDPSASLAEVQQAYRDNDGVPDLPPVKPAVRRRPVTQVASQCPFCPH